MTLQEVSISKSTALCTAIALLFFALLSVRGYSPNITVSLAGGLALLLLVYRHLRTRGFSVLTAAAILLFMLLEVALLHSLTTNIGATWFALAVYLVAVAAAEFIAREDARSVIFLGFSLALVQLQTHIGIVVAAIMLAICVGIPSSFNEIKRWGGVYSLLLFIPVTACAALFFMPAGPFGVPAFNVDPIPQLSMTRYLGLTVLALGAVTPALWLTAVVQSLRSIEGQFAVITALVMSIALTADGVIYHRQDLGLIFATTIGCSVAAIRTWRPASPNSELAVASSALGAVMAWWLIAAAGWMR